MRILLCTGGSPHGQAALRLGASLAQGSPEAATMLGVVERPGERPLVERALEEGRKWLAGAPEPRIQTREGHASEEILAEAAREPYDLLVVGTRGRRGITRFLLGSTAELIVRQANVPETGIALILGVDRIIDMLRTSVNITGDLTGATLIARTEGELVETESTSLG